MTRPFFLAALRQEAAAIVFGVFAAGPMLHAVGCGPIAPGTATAIETIDAIACSGAGIAATILAPPIGAAILAACPGEEAAVRALVESHVARDGGAADAGAAPVVSFLEPQPMPAPLPGERAAAYCRRADAGRALFVERAGKRVHVGCAR